MLQGGRALRPRGARDAEPAVPSAAPAAPAAPLPLDQSAYDKIAAEVARRGSVFRAEQEAQSRARLLAQALETMPPEV